MDLNSLMIVPTSIIHWIGENARSVETLLKILSYWRVWNDNQFESETREAQRVIN